MLSEHNNQSITDEYFLATEHTRRVQGHYLYCGLPSIGYDIDVPTSAIFVMISMI